MAARFLINLGGTQFVLRRFEAALQTYQRAHELALQAGDASTVAILTANIASLYSEMGELEAAAKWLERSIRQLSGPDRVSFLPKVQIQLATVRARQGRMPEALVLFGEAIDAADRAGNLPLYALAWNRLGEEYLRLGDPAKAELPLLEAWRVRRLHGMQLDSSLFNLAKLELAQGDGKMAGALLDRTVELTAQPQGMLPTWEVYLTRGTVRLRQDRLREALADLRIALRLARAWRWSAPLDEASRIGAGSTLHQVYSTLIEADNRLFLRTGDISALREAIDIAEENRAFSLRALLSDPNAFRAQLPAEYWAAIGRLQQAEVQALREPSAGRREAVRSLRADLVRMEAGLGPGGNEETCDVARRTIAALDSSTAALVFHLGESRSWLWGIDRNGAVVHALPPAGDIVAAVEALTGAIRSGEPGWQAASQRMHAILFSQLEERFLRKSSWLLALDSRLFDAPLCTLGDRRSGRWHVLAEERSVQVIPGLSWVFDRDRPGRALDGQFVGLGDAIYNRADPRYGRPAAVTLDLPRLVDSGAEIEACGRAWGGVPPVLLRGADASRFRLLQAIQNKPAVVHIAAHVLESTQRPSYGLIALSPGPQGRTEVLTPYEIARWRIDVPLVVLSGCSSARGATLPGVGLLGLTRAWLAAGAGRVLATRWRTPDAGTALFASFYRHLRANRRAGPAEALRSAQRDMLEAGDWRSHPRYWAAYFVIGAAGERKVN